MASNDATIALDGFLAAHAPIDAHPAFAQGEMFGDWRVMAFLGRGGSGEVYRVVHATLGIAAALKVSPRPIFTWFDSMEQLKAEVYGLAKGIYRDTARRG